MERRAYFIFGDLLACVLAGIAGGWLTGLIVTGGWYALPAGVAGLVLGMTAGALIGFLCSPFFGAFEVILPAMLAGQMGGMGAGITKAWNVAPAESAVLIGVLAGLLTLAFTYFMQARLGGEAE